MPKSMNKTLSLTVKSIEDLDELCKESNLDSSKLFRAFISYFKANPIKFKEICGLNDKNV